MIYLSVRKKPEPLSGSPRVSQNPPEVREMGAGLGAPVGRFCQETWSTSQPQMWSSTLDRTRTCVKLPSWSGVESCNLASYLVSMFICLYAVKRTLRTLALDIREVAT
jgi:hypothetical protein